MLGLPYRGVRIKVASLSCPWRANDCAIQRPVCTRAMKLETSSLAALRALPSHESMYPHGLISLAIPCKRMPEMIGDLGTTSIQEFQESKFVKPQSVFYELNGEKRRWYACQQSSRLNMQACPRHNTELYRVTTCYFVCIPELVDHSVRCRPAQPSSGVSIAATPSILRYHRTTLCLEIPDLHPQ